MLCKVAGMVVDEADCSGGSQFWVEEVFCNFTGGQVGHGDATYCQGTRPTGWLGRFKEMREAQVVIRDTSD